MKNLIFILLLIFCSTFLFSQTTIPGGNVSGIWLQSGSPYLIEGQITIPDGQTLTIDPGCLIEFQVHYKFKVQGRLLAIGTEQDSIIFTVADTTGFSNFDIPDGSWHGIRFENTPTTNDSSKIVYCHLEYGKAIGNTTDDKNGGAIFIDGFPKVLISNCTVVNNKCKRDGGGIYCSDAAQIKHSIIQNNCAYEYGGGICFGYPNPGIYNSIVCNNKAETGGGGGIEVYGGCDPQIINTIISNNTSYLEGGGIRTMASSGTKIINSLICNNDNHGIYAYECSPIVTNTDIVNNIGYGHLFGEDPWPLNSNEIPRDTEIKKDFLNRENRVVFTNSILWGNTQGENWIGNTYNLENVDPMFVDPSSGCGIEFNGLAADWSLMIESMLINYGTEDTTGLNLPEYDLAENPRIFQGEVARVDIGAYEFQEDPLRPYFDINTEQILFGYWQIDEEIDEQMFIIYNRGSINLEISSITAPDGFQIRKPGEDWTSQITDLVVQPDCFQFIYVLFHPEELGEYDDYITFVTNDVINDLQIHVDGVAVESLMRVSENIYEDTTWDTDYVIIENNISVSSNTLLTILPYTKVIQDFNLSISGDLNAIGTATDSIYFTSSPYRKRRNLKLGIYGGGNSHLEYCILENSSTHGIVGANTSEYNYHIENCLFRNNYGAGANLGSGNSNISNCIFRDNHSGGFIGRGIISKCILFNNSGGYAIKQYFTTLDIYNSLIFNNSEGVYVAVGDYINNNTIINNQSTGLVVYCTFDGIFITNNIIYDNGTPEDETQIFIHPNPYHYSFIRNNVISGGIENIVIDGNESTVIITEIIDMNPEFVDIQSNNYRLLETSPCIDAGNSSNIPEEFLISDLDGNVRIWDGDGNGVAVIDIGCYEFGAPVSTSTDDYLINHVPKYELHNNFPNPFNPSTTISFSNSEKSKVLLNVYNIKGQKVKTLVKDTFESGTHSVIWEGSDDSGKSVCSGIYFYQLMIDNKPITAKKCLLIK
ncbi:MAG: right-handed parallel beta-helix repeat-containing protein [Armatimonadetes bacterium]|nr:right-handed parallel beta-helix repeat-containing protein [Armatimonadota bacterium]